MEALRTAARAALAASGNAPTSAVSDVTRLTLDVQGEIVSLQMDGGRLQISCTCGKPGCAHARGALTLVAGEEPSAPTSLTVLPATRSLAPAVRTSVTPTPEPRSGAALEEPHEVGLADALEELVIAVVRNGVSEPSGPSVIDAIERFVRALPTPEPVDALRFVGRLRQALDAADTLATAQLLAAATQWIDDARVENASADARARACAWLGATHPGSRHERLTDRTLVEIARETVSGTERAQLERRYLIELVSGEVLREDRLRRAADGSIGPCPRSVGVGLAELGPGQPRSVRLLQYTVSAEVDADAWQRVQRWAQRDFRQLRKQQVSELERFAGLHEPFALLAPASVRVEAVPLLVDDAQNAIGLWGEDDLGVVRRVAELASQAGSQVAWIAGRLCQREQSLMLRPLALGLLHGPLLRHERL